MKKQVAPVNNKAIKKIKNRRKKYKPANKKSKIKNKNIKRRIKYTNKYLKGTKKIIIYMNLNTLPFNKKRFSKEWLNYRISIFMKYTLQSLKKQTNQDFTALVSYHDKSKQIINNLLAKYEVLPNNIQFINHKEINKLIANIIKGYDYLFLVRLDCDDMYHKDFVQKLHDYTPKKTTKVLINQKGYIYDSKRNGIIKTHRKSPPFYTLVYKVNEYIKGKRYNMPGGHTYAIKLPHEILTGRNYVIVIHSKNTSKNTSNSYKKSRHDNRITNKNKIKQILKDFMLEV